MPPATEHIDPRAKLVDEVADWLKDYTRPCPASVRLDRPSSPDNP